MNYSSQLFSWMLVLIDLRNTKTVGLVFYSGKHNSICFILVSNNYDIITILHSFLPERSNQINSFNLSILFCCLFNIENWLYIMWQKYAYIAIWKFHFYGGHGFWKYKCLTAWWVYDDFKRNKSTNEITMGQRKHKD